MNKLKLTILFLFMSLAASAQRLAVESLKLRPNDLSARNVKNQRHDLNGKPCALLKVMVMDNITKCSSGNIGDIVTEGPVKLIYITSATPSIELSFQYHYPLTINFADYGYKHLEGNSTYELNLVDALQMMMGNGNMAQQNTTATTTQQVSSSQNTNAAQQTAPATTAQNVGNNQNNSLSMSANEAYKIAADAYNAKDYDKALKYYKYAAEKNDSQAQFSLGAMYDMGNGVTQNYAEAMKWYLKAANQGNASAQNNIGVMYEKGQGVKQDCSEANKWYLKAAEQGYTPAQSNLGLNLYVGNGITQNYTEAFKWLLKAANSGGASAQYNVAGMYFFGQGVKQDYSEALKWYTKASDQGDTDALYFLGLMYAYGNGMKSQNIAEALKCLYKAAQKGHKAAIAKLDEYRKNGNIIGVVIEKDTNEPVVGSVVKIVNSSRRSANAASVSDINGFFSLNANVGDEIEVQYVGYKNSRVKITDDKPLMIYIYK
ncbi:tetratricopeptide repeat protein [Prevotella sp.]|uniref:tetratricopeptide repeat protein n=1 Tax=Prevotella sp. TaxID=59823 RepID=UPI0025DACB2B|nr:tetratricopeptide repeat protein [Prevotella sp.]